MRFVHRRPEHFGALRSIILFIIIDNVADLTLTLSWWSSMWLEMSVIEPCKPPTHGWFTSGCFLKLQLGCSWKRVVLTSGWFLQRVILTSGWNLRAGDSYKRVILSSGWFLQRVIHTGGGVIFTKSGSYMRMVLTSGFLHKRVILTSRRFTKSGDS